jgi:uncharacterized protein YdaT
MDDPLKKKRKPKGMKAMKGAKRKKAREAAPFAVKHGAKESSAIKTSNKALGKVRMPRERARGEGEMEQYAARRRKPQGM